MRLKPLNSVIIIGLLFMLACTQSEKPSLDSYLHPESLATLKKGKQIQLSSYDTTGGNNDRINIPEGETAEIANVEGPGVITRLWFTIDSRDPYFLRRVLIRMYWDDEKTPSVEVPFGDFFGSGFSYIHHTPHFVGMSSGGYYSYFPMPFNKNARIEIVNETGMEIFAFYYHVNYYKLDQQWDENTGYFHAQWNRDIRTDYDSNYTVLDAHGRGQFVGLNFSGQPYNKSLFYLEGDEMIYVDNDTFPSIHGTGLEDYFTSGWYFKNGEFSAEYHGLVLKDEESGRVTAYRHHVTDAIPFQDSIKVTLEHGSENKEIVDFSSTAFWYQMEPHKVFKSIKKAGLRIPLQRPVPNGSIEAENLSINTKLSHKTVDMTDYGSDWSNGAQLRVEGDSTNGHFSLTIPNLIEDAYNADIYVTNGPDMGKVTVRNREHKVGEYDGKAAKRMLEKPISLENLIPSDGKLILDFELTGGATEIDALHLTPVRKYIPEWYMIGPFANPRESDYERFGLDSIYPPERVIDLTAAYQGADGQEVSWFKVNGEPGGYGMNLWERFQPSEFIIVYALTYVYSPEEQTVPLYIGSDDGAKVFLNDKELYRFLEVRIAAPDQDKIDLNLKKGWNKLLVKAENNFGGFAFYTRIVDVNKNLKFSIDKK